MQIFIIFSNLLKNIASSQSLDIKDNTIELECNNTQRNLYSSFLQSKFRDMQQLYAQKSWIRIGFKIFNFILFKNPKEQKSICYNQQQINFQLRSRLNLKQTPMIAHGFSLSTNLQKVGCSRNQKEVQILKIVVDWIDCIWRNQLKQQLDKGLSINIKKHFELLQTKLTNFIIIQIMDQFETIEGKILYITYNLYKQDRICIQQKNEIKDMLISKDHRIEKLLLELRGGHSVTHIENSLETINDLSPRDFDDSLSNSYKNKRPKRFKFLKSNFPRNLDTKEIRANDDSDSQSRNSNQQFEFDSRRRVYSLAAGSC